MVISADHTAKGHKGKSPAVEPEAQAEEVRRKFGVSLEAYMLPAHRQIQMVDPDGNLKAQEDQGTEPGHEYPIPDDEELLAAYDIRAN